MGSYLGTSFERQGEHKGSEAEGADGLAYTRSRDGYFFYSIWKEKNKTVIFGIHMAKVTKTECQKILSYTEKSKKGQAF